MLLKQYTIMVYNRGEVESMPNVLDKYKPTYDLNSFKHSDYGIKQSALSGAAAMGFERRDILQAVESM